MPLLLLAFLISSLLSIAYPFILYYLYREWERYRHTAYAEHAQHCLQGAVALLVFIVLGRFFIKFLLSKSRRGEDNPKFFRANKRETIKRPDGTSINIEYYGKAGGDTILFVHGWNANLQNWYYQKKFFEPDCQLILMDLAGLGRSTRPKNKDYSLDKMAADLNAVIEHTGVHNAILWGHSMGGMTILTLLGKYKHTVKTKIKGIILEHTTYTNPVKTVLFSRLMTALQKPVLVPLCWLMICLSPLFWISRWMSYINGNVHLMTRWLTFAGTQTQKQLDFSTLLSTLASPAVMARGVLAMFKYDVSKELETIDTPTLIIAAHKDRLTRPSASKHMRDHIPNSKLTEVWPGNHQALLERHKEVNAAAESFIKSLK